MAKENNPNRMKINPMWIYGGILAVIVLYNLFSNGINYNEPKKIPSSEFNTLLEKGEIQKVIVYDKSQAEVYLTDVALKEKEHTKQQNHV